MIEVQIAHLSTGIPLRDVVAFLRPRGALGVLEGAPFADFPGAPIYALRGYELESQNMNALLARKPDAVLYLGDGELCPAAEAWAARVLALARGLDDPQDVRLWGAGYGADLHIGRLWGEDSAWNWRWSGYDPEPYEGHEFTLLPGQAPPTPAERLAAVLVYEMERAK